MTKFLFIKQCYTRFFLCIFENNTIHFIIMVISKMLFVPSMIFKYMHPPSSPSPPDFVFCFLHYLPIFAYFSSVFAISCPSLPIFVLFLPIFAHFYQFLFCFLFVIYLSAVLMFPLCLCSFIACFPHVFPNFCLFVFTHINIVYISLYYLCLFGKYTQ
jgi:hypothetical protein